MYTDGAHQFNHHCSKVTEKSEKAEVPKEEKKKKKKKQNSLAKVLLTEAKVKMHWLKEVLTSRLLFLCSANLISY